MMPTPPKAIPFQGRTSIRVRYCECDPMGVAHHASYVPWFEIGRTELLRAADISYAELEESGIFLVITRLEVKYRQPARYDNQLTVITTVTRGGRARIDHDYELWLDEPGRERTHLLATASTTLACVGSDGRPRPLPEWL
ncbi:MAG: acyl-CoA thioesterase, partial [Phycisphaerales bacterium]|nr:acyl-CoA thioesterase [Phycisphaerales bacterium]